MTIGTDFNHEFDLYQDCRLVRTATVVMRASTWRQSDSEEVGQDQVDALKQFLDAPIDKFISAFKAVNPDV